MSKFTRGRRVKFLIVTELRNKAREAYYDYSVKRNPDDKANSWPWDIGHAPTFAANQGIQMPVSRQVLAVLAIRPERRARVG